MIDGALVGHGVCPGRQQRGRDLGRGRRSAGVEPGRLRNAGALRPARFGCCPTARQLDTWSRKIGFRSLELDRSVDGVGSRFMFRINGTPILAKGVNWIPDDVLPGRMTRERYEVRLRQALAANVNLIRVWGGGIYESDDFYDVCDELGLLVWQDFLFACAAYPEEEPLRGEVLAEARDNVARLAGTRAWCCGTATTRICGCTRPSRWAEHGRRAADLGRALLPGGSACGRRRGRSVPAVLGGKPVVWELGAPAQRPGSPDVSFLGRLESG